MSEPTSQPGAEQQALQAACAEQLKALFPALFAGAPKPVKLRIQADIQERAPGQFSKQQLSSFLRRHTGSTAYLNAVIKSTHRFDLDGKEAGEITAEHKQVARDELTRRRAKHQERQAQEDAAQRQRFELLRAFETTTLTRANFCALKGLAEEQLDGLLAQAREEAKAWAARPRPSEGGRGGAPGDRRGGPGPDRRGPRQGRPDDRRPGRGAAGKGAVQGRPQSGRPASARPASAESRPSGDAAMAAAPVEAGMPPSGTDGAQGEA
ncbi:prop effector ProQ [Mitsuaria sp. WAJ17]|uniref:ProQ/FINO family protein n=1 Tax=Mitsuaria sp. WAJ17 TaxID=2761452 RepID=UPI001603EC53|nr:ProQ/FinO family protein [Mitsuaria sp. WAJ17]MBB2485260.1 prop effector ProQ [Mitsuaria sp. WAJ17]